MKLNIGCGKDVREGYVNMDIRKTPGVDVVRDLNKLPYPFKKEQFEEVLAYNVLEHLEDPCAVLEELHRILKNNGVLKITVPHFSSWTAWQDPTHKRPFGYDSFAYFSADTTKHFCGLKDQEHFFSFKFSKIKRKLIFSKGLHLWNYFIEPFANAFPYLWEHTFLKNLFPAETLEVRMVK